MSSTQRNLRKLVCKEIIYIRLIVTLLPLSFSADAQQIGKVHRIGVLDEGTPGGRTSREIRPFRNGLRGLGYVDGKNIVLEYRNADGKIERLPGLMAELLHLGPDVIIATSGAFSMAARQATSVVPIVMTVSGDPVASDLAASLARPGGNVTGLTIVPRELSGKRLEVLKEAIPGISRITVLWSQAAVKEPADLRETKRVARTLRLHVHSLRLEAAGELENAFERPAAVGAQALIPLSHRFIAIHRNRLIALARRDDCQRCMQTGTL